MTSPANRLNVLVVDDEPCVGSTLQVLLRRKARVTSAESCEAAVELLTQQPEAVDVAVVDLHFPTPMQGDELIGVIRARWPRLPLLVLTANYGVPQALRCGHLGVATFLSKVPDLSQSALPAIEATLAQLQARRLPEGSEPRDAAGRPAARPVPLDAVVRDACLSALRSSDGNMSRAARLLQVPYHSFRRRLIAGGLVSPTRRPYCRRSAWPRQAGGPRGCGPRSRSHRGN
jgi:DNA-binding NtrC family response regulator